MPELNVFFWGLICHVNIRGHEGTSDYAALVNAHPTHVPKILFSRKPEDIYTLDPDVDIGYQHGTETATLDQSIGEAVPRLQEILGGTPRIAAQDAIIARYPKADTGRPHLSVFDRYKYTATHRSIFSGATKRHNRPVARILRARVPVDGDTVTVQFRGTNKKGETVTSKTIPSSSCILITNLEDTALYEAGLHIENAARALLNREERTKEQIEPDGNPALLLLQASLEMRHYSSNVASVSQNHFEYYTKLFAGADTVAALPFEPLTTAEPNPPEGCDWVLDYVTFVESIVRGGVRPECGNTTYP
jgi:hypothetical protein